VSAHRGTARLVLARLAALPGGPEVCEAASAHQGVLAVGGVVRDLLLGRTPREIDLVVEGPLEPVLRDLAARLAGSVSAHERFGTATLEADGIRVDLARARAERYPRPGALPVVRTATLAEDLARRDFTVNAMAVALDERAGSAIQAVARAREDLRARRLRVLHARSFVDDPTRLLRLGRYAGRLAFSIERATRELSRQAVDQRALDTVSPARVGSELRLALAEDDAPQVFDALARLGVLGALLPGLAWRPELARRAADLLPLDARADLTLLATCALDLDVGVLRTWLDALEFPATDRRTVVAAATRGRDLAAQVSGRPRRSELARTLRGAPAEAVALAGALGSARAAREWLEEVRHVRLEIGGDDLVAAGVAPGPAVGRGLEAALARKLDGELRPGREAELREALRASGAAAPRD
jgi:tRNA nucleotidyltransferase (CCA-adding enzyme)